MTEVPPNQDAAASEDVAWATIAAPIPAEAAATFLRDVERLFRLNPYLEIEAWSEEAGPFAPGKRYRLAALNEMNGIRQDLTVTLEAVDDLGYTLAYDRGLKRATQVLLEPDGGAARLSSRSPGRPKNDLAPTGGGSDLRAEPGALLTLRDHYHDSRDIPEGPEREERLKEVDRSLVPWAASIHDYLRGHARWSWFAPYRWYKERFWLGMPPRHRRITRLIVWTTLLEFVVFLFVFVIYWLESQRV